MLADDDLDIPVDVILDVEAEAEAGVYDLGYEAEVSDVVSEEPAPPPPAAGNGGAAAGDRRVRFLEGLLQQVRDRKRSLH